MTTVKGVVPGQVLYLVAMLLPLALAVSAAVVVGLYERGSAGYNLVGVPAILLCVAIGVAVFTPDRLDLWPSFAGVAGALGGLFLSLAVQEILRPDASPTGEALLSVTMVVWPAAGGVISWLLARHARALAEYAGEQAEHDAE